MDDANPVEKRRNLMTQPQVSIITYPKKEEKAAVASIPSGIGPTM
jgi:hypothetical protein